MAFFVDNHMSRFHAYLNNAAALVQQYEGTVPLAAYLKKYFAEHKKFGSSDRRIVAGLCHQYFRLGGIGSGLPVEERILLAEWICNKGFSALLGALNAGWNEASSLSIAEKLRIAGLNGSAEVHTPWYHLIQPEINIGDYATSLLVQPDLFLRIRRGKYKQVKDKLIAAGIDFTEEHPTCFRLPNRTPLEEILQLNREAVIQDKSSQQSVAVIKKIIPQFRGTLWDACAASGGKSLALYDLYPDGFNLMVSDIRESILANLHTRFREAGISGYKSFAADLSKPLSGNTNTVKADIILVDAPCTGSGTWSRTPEQHFFFRPELISHFSERQLTICKNVTGRLKKGGHIIYITCSVFKAENEEIAGRLCAEEKLTLIHQEIIDGTREKADSMYIAILQKD